MPQSTTVTGKKTHKISEESKITPYFGTFQNNKSLFKWQKTLSANTSNYDNRSIAC